MPQDLNPDHLCQSLPCLVCGRQPAVPIGTRVRVGSGRTVWLVTGYVPLGPDRYVHAVLAAVEGYANTTVIPSRLRPAPSF